MLIKIHFIWHILLMSDNNSTKIASLVVLTEFVYTFHTSINRYAIAFIVEYFSMS